jgi:hypothetical protein
MNNIKSALLMTAGAYDIFLAKSRFHAMITTTVRLAKNETTFNLGVKIGLYN